MCVVGMSSLSEYFLSRFYDIEMTALQLMSRLSWKPRRSFSTIMMMNSLVFQSAPHTSDCRRRRFFLVLLPGLFMAAAQLGSVFHFASEIRRNSLRSFSSTSSSFLVSFLTMFNHSFSSAWGGGKILRYTLNET